MDWLFDLGNTRLKCAPLQADGSFGDVLAAAHGGVDPAQACAGILPTRGNVAYLASVAGPALTVGLLDALTRRFRRINTDRDNFKFFTNRERQRLQTMHQPIERHRAQHRTFEVNK